MNPEPAARECLAKLERLSCLQARAVQNEKMLSLDRILRIRQIYLDMLQKALLERRDPLLAKKDSLGQEEENFKRALEHLISEDEKNVRRAVEKLEGICEELTALRNKGKLMGSYSA